jgi:hypothetical protein
MPTYDSVAARKNDSVLAVERLGKMARQLYVMYLILTHWYICRSVHIKKNI